MEPESPPVAEPAVPRDDADGRALTRRGFLGALAVAIGSGLLILLLWLIARGAPSSRRDPNFVLQSPVPTRAPKPTPTST